MGGKILVGSNFTGFKNRIINGDFSVWQRGTSFTFSSGVGAYTADKVRTGNTSDGQFTVTRSTLNNDNAIRFIVDTPPTDLTLANEFHGLTYQFEGQHLYDLAINGKDITISFWFNSNVSGIYPVCVRNSTDSAIQYQSYVTSFVYSTANSAQKVEVTIPLNAAWNPALKNDSAIGLELSIGFLNQGDFVSPSTDAWIDGNYLTTSTTVNWGATAGNFIEIAGLQLEEGNVATEFEHVPYDIQLLRCMRYYEKSYEDSPTEIGGAIHFSASSTNTTYPFDGGVELKVPKRTIPTLTAYSPDTGASGVIRDVDGGVDIVVSIKAESQQRIRAIFFDQGTVAVGGGRYRYNYEVDAELR